MKFIATIIGLAFVAAESSNLRKDLNNLLTSDLKKGLKSGPHKNDCDEPTQNGKMNILVFYASDHRADMIGSSSEPMAANARTPNLDALASNSIVFTNNYVTTPVDWSSAASFYSGKYTYNHQVYWNTDSCKNCETDVFRAVHGADYYTGHIGKWAVAKDNVLDYVDYSVSYEGWYYKDIADAGVMWHVTERNEHDTLRFNREGRDFCFPFFFVTGFFANTALFDDPEQYYPQFYSQAIYRYITIVPPVTNTEEDWNNMPEFFHGTANRNRAFYNIRFAPEVFQTMSKKIYRLVLELDHAMGVVMEDLENQGLLDSTMVIITSGNGMSMGERGLAEKATPFEEVLRTPLLIKDPRMPASKAGTKVTELTLNIDLAPTILSAAGVSSDDFPEEWQGRDLAELYLGTETPEWREDFYFEFLADNAGASQPTFDGLLVSEQWKYIMWNQYDYEQLFNLSSDPYEQYNLASNTEYADKLVELRARYSELKMNARNGEKV